MGYFATFQTVKAPADGREPTSNDMSSENNSNGENSVTEENAGEVTDVVDFAAAYAEPLMGLKGSPICLPHKDAGPGTITTMECRFGLKAADGNNYGLDMSKVADSGFDWQSAESLVVDGKWVAADVLNGENSNNIWLRYDIVGVVEVEEIRQGSEAAAGGDVVVDDDESEAAAREEAEAAASGV